MTHITLPRATVEQALEALERTADPADEWPFAVAQRRQSAITALRAALAQQVEPVEPVAWVRLEAWKSGQSWPDDCFTALPAEGLTPLYTAPPQRKPLTEEEIERLWYPSAAIAEPGKRRVAFGRAVERAHGIKE